MTFSDQFNQNNQSENHEKAEHKCINCGKMVLNHSFEKKLATKIGDALAFYEAGEFTKAKRIFKRVIRYRGKLTENVKIMITDALEDLAFVYEELGLYEKSLKYYEKAQKKAMLLKDDKEKREFFIKMNKCLLILEKLENLKEKNRLLEILFQTNKSMLQTMRKKPNLLYNTKVNEDFYSFVLHSTQVLLANGFEKQTEDLVNYVVNNYLILRSSKFKTQAEYYILGIIKFFAESLYSKKHKKRAIRKYLSFIINNFSFLNYKNSKLVYQASLFEMIVFMESSQGYKNFKYYSSLYLDKYESNSYENDYTAGQVLKVLSISYDKYFNADKFDLALIIVEKLKKFEKENKEIFKKQQIENLTRLEAECLAGKGQFSEAEKLLLSDEAKENLPESLYLESLKYLKNFAIRYERYKKALEYSKDIILYLDNHPDISEWNYEYACDLFDYGVLCEECNKPETAQKAFKKCENLFINSNNPKVKSLAEESREMNLE